MSANVITLARNEALHIARRPGAAAGCYEWIDGRWQRAVTTPEQVKAQLEADLINELTHAVIRGNYIHYGNGAPSELACDVINSNADCNPDLDKLRMEAWGAAINGNADALFTYYARRALVHYAQILADLIQDGQRITFGAKA